MRIIDHFVVGGPCSGKRQYKPTLLDSVSAFNKDTKVKKAALHGDCLGAWSRRLEFAVRRR